MKKTGYSKSKVNKLIAETSSDYDGLISDRGIAHMIANKLEINIESSKPKRSIKELEDTHERLTKKKKSHPIIRFIKSHPFFTFTFLVTIWAIFALANFTYYETGYYSYLESLTFSSTMVIPISFALFFSLYGLINY